MVTLPAPFPIRAASLSRTLSRCASDCTVRLLSHAIWIQTDLTCHILEKVAMRGLFPPSQLVSSHSGFAQLRVKLIFGWGRMEESQLVALCLFVCMFNEYEHREVCITVALLPQSLYNHDIPGQSPPHIQACPSIH